MTIEPVESFLSELAQGRAGLNQTRALSLADVPQSLDRPLQVQVLAAPAQPDGAPVLVVFHGAIKQEIRGYPYFAGSFAVAAAQRYGATLISVCDPTLSCHPDLAACWYQGAQDLPVPAMVRSFLRRLVSGLAPSRLVFYGSSVGGHPALLHGLDHAESVVIAQNAITTIPAYYESHRQRFLRHCWPEAARLSDLAEDVTLDVGALYARGHKHTLIYAQNPTDHHFKSQAVNFLNQVKSVRRVLFISEFLEEYQGHVVPPVHAAEWVAAALAADGTDAADIAACRADLFAGGGDAGRKAGAARPATRKSDAVTAQRLVAFARRRLEQQG